MNDRKTPSLPLWKEITIDYLIPLGLGAVLGNTLDFYIRGTVSFPIELLLCLGIGIFVGAFIYGPIVPFLKGR